MKMTSKNSVLGFSSGALALVLAGVAWACTAVPSCAGAPDSGPAGTRVTLNCIGFNQQSPVEIRWGGSDGPVVGSTETSARDGSFAVSFTPPADAPADVHYVVAVQRDAAGSVLRKASTTFELTTPGEAAGTARSALDNVWAGFSSSKADVGAPGTGAEAPTSNNAFALGSILLAVGMISMALAGVALIRRPRRSRKP